MKKRLLQVKMLKPFLLALSLLTRLPVKHINALQESDSGKSALYYPLVGLIIGLLLYLPVAFFNEFSQISIAAVIVVLWAMITGGLHLDGLADSADGWLGGLGDKEKIIRIMKDPVVGSAGVIAITSIMILKFAVLTNILQSSFHGMFSTSGIIILAPVISRAMILLLLLTTHYASKDGMASSLVTHLPRQHALFIAGACMLIGFYFSMWGMIFALVGFWLLRRLMIKHLGGCTGDTIGATVEITEVLFLLGYLF